MKIQGLGVQSKAIPFNRGNESIGAAGDTAGKSFDDFLQGSGHRALHEELAKLLENVEDQGRILSERLNLRELLEYKKAVNQFMDKAVDGMFKLHKGDFLDRRGGHSTYSVVTKLNEKLERLTEEVLAKEKERLVIVSRLDEIRGMLMDLCV